MPLAVGVAARDEDAPVGDVRERRPHLLAVDDEAVAVGSEPRARAHGREVGARAGLGEALAPDLLGREDLLEVLLLLRLGAVRDDRRPRHPEPDHAEVRRRLRARHLLEEDRLVAVRRTRRRRTPSARSARRSRRRRGFGSTRGPASSKRPRRISSVRFASIQARSSARNWPPRACREDPRRDSTPSGRGDHAIEALGLLDEEQMAGPLEVLESRAGDAAGELDAVLVRHDPVGVTVDDERRRLDLLDRPMFDDEVARKPRTARASTPAASGIRGGRAAAVRTPRGAPPSTRAETSAASSPARYSAAGLSAFASHTAFVSAGTPCGVGATRARAHQHQPLDEARGGGARPSGRGSRPSRSRRRARGGRPAPRRRRRPSPRSSTAPAASGSGPCRGSRPRRTETAATRPAAAAATTRSRSRGPSAGAAGVRPRFLE